MYHEVSTRSEPRFAKYVVSPGVFTRQMLWLKVAGYQPVSLDALLHDSPEAPSLPPRPVIITFDDGFEDCAQHAAEVLHARGFPATFFLVAGLLGRTSRWLRAEHGIDLPLLGWPTARRLLAAGFACGAHSLTHPRLSAIDDERCRRELEQSRMMLEDGLGRPIVHCAYPFGAVNPRVRERARQAGYRTACTVEIGIATPGDDLLMLRRVPVVGTETLADFACRLRTGHSVADVCRRVVHNRMFQSRSRRHELS
jgi:peptidoglycan/xylan/chitin deacetylase (PgdA/CDA1 family)